MMSATVVPRDRFVTGPFGDFGYIAKPPGHGASMEKILQVRATNRVAEFNEKIKKRDTKMTAFMNNYFQKLDMLTFRASVKRMVELGMQEADNDFVVKQNKLKQVLLEEQSGFTQEYTIKAQTALEQKLAGERKKAEEILKMQMDADKLITEEVNTNRIMQQCEEFKDKLQRLSSKNTSEALKEQILVKENQKRMEREENFIWDSLWDEECRKAKMRREREQEEAEQRRRQLHESLEKQIEDEKLRRQRQAHIDEVQEERDRKIRQIWEERLSKRDEAAKKSRELHEKALFMQIEADRERAEKSLREELLVERIMAEDRRKKAEKEAAATISNKLKKWNELTVFKESVVQFRKSVAAREQETEKYIENQRDILQRKMWEAKAITAKAQRDLRTDCVETSKRMVEEKTKRSNELKSLESKRFELAEMRRNLNDRLDAEVNHRTAVNRESYNKAQLEYKSTLVQRQKQEDEEMLEKMRQFSVEQTKRIQASLERPVPEITGTSLHPFYKYFLAQNRENIKRE